MSKFNVGDEVRDIETGIQTEILAIGPNFRAYPYCIRINHELTWREESQLRPATLTLTEVKQ